jgi:tetratricopeptide (TPR) repeat protein
MSLDLKSIYINYCYITFRGQIWLGDYFQASETFFRLEGMNNWSRAFYHYIATCCMFADEEYDKAAIEYMQIPDILRRQEKFGGRLLPDEMFAARKIQGWKKKAEVLKAGNGQCLTGATLKQIVVVNPLWELIYLWNGIPHINADVLMTMKSKLQSQIAELQESPIECSSVVTECTAQSDIAILYLLYGTVIRELGDQDLSQHYLGKVIAMEKKIIEDRWTVPYAMYELAIIFAMDPNRQNDAKVWIKRAETFFQGSQHYSARSPSELATNNGGDTEWENRLHVRCRRALMPNVMSSPNAFWRSSKAPPYAKLRHRN